MSAITVNDENAVLCTIIKLQDHMRNDWLIGTWKGAAEVSDHIRNDQLSVPQKWSETNLRRQNDSKRQKATLW